MFHNNLDGYNLLYRNRLVFVEKARHPKIFCAGKNTLQKGKRVLTEKVFSSIMYRMKLPVSIISDGSL